MLFSLKFITCIALGISISLLFSLVPQVLTSSQLSVIAQVPTNQNKENERKLEIMIKALEIVRTMRDKTKEATILNNIGLIYRQKGEYKKALEYYQQALAIEKELVNKAQQAIVLNNMGVAYEKLSQYDQAVDSYSESLAIASAIENKSLVVANLNNLGLVYDNLGHYTQAINYYQKALTIVEDRKTKGKILNNMGGVYDVLGQHRKALDYYQQALIIKKELFDRIGEGTTLNNIGVAYRNLGEYEQALDFFEQALAVRNEINDKAGKGVTLANRGLVYDKQGKYEKALEDYKQALNISREVENNKGERITLNNIGQVYFNQGLYPKALEYYKQALIIFHKLGNRLEEGATLNNIGLVYFRLNRYVDASKNLMDAIEIWESLRPSELNDFNKISIFETQAHTYRIMQRVLVAQNHTNSALEIAERGRARAFVALLATRLSSSQLIPTSQVPKLPTIAQIQQIAQEQKATLVTYSLVVHDFSLNQKQQQLYIWVIQPDGEVVWREADLSSLDTSLEELVTFSRESIGVRSRGSSFEHEPVEGLSQTQQLQKLHQILIQPIADLLPQEPEERVIFLPQESLFFVPFPALQDDRGTYLIEKHTISTAPAIQALELTGQQKEKVRAAAVEDILVVGNPTMPTVTTQIGETPEPLNPLLGAETEALEIAKLLQTKALINKQAKKTAIVQQMPKAKIIHLATHGLLDDFTGQGVPGAIALAPSGTGELNDGLLTANEILEMKLNAELVVLSACDTGLGNITGDGVIGLSRSLFIAGTPSIIVSLWSVPDAPTASLMSEFYRNLNHGLDKAQALRQAMLMTMKQHPEPKNWAAFTLIGETD